MSGDNVEASSNKKYFHYPVWASVGLLLICVILAFCVHLLNQSADKTTANSVVRVVSESEHVIEVDVVIDLALKAIAGIVGLFVAGQLWRQSDINQEQIRLQRNEQLADHMREATLGLYEHEGYRQVCISQLCSIARTRREWSPSIELALKENAKWVLEQKILRNLEFDPFYLELDEMYRPEYMHNVFSKEWPNHMQRDDAFEMAQRLQKERHDLSGAQADAASQPEGQA